MDFDIYISNLKDGLHDNYIKNQNWTNYYGPESISYRYQLKDLFWDVLHDKNMKQTGWGTHVIKLTNTELIEYLSKYVTKYEKNLEEHLEKISEDNKESYIEYYKKNYLYQINAFLRNAKELPDGEYLLVAQGW